MLKYMLIGLVAGNILVCIVMDSKYLKTKLCNVWKFMKKKVYEDYYEEDKE